MKKTLILILAIAYQVVFPAEIYLENGDEVSGKIVDVTNLAITVVSDPKARTIPIDQIVAIRNNDSLNTGPFIADTLKRFISPEAQIKWKENVLSVPTDVNTTKNKEFKHQYSIIAQPLKNIANVWDVPAIRLSAIQKVDPINAFGINFAYFNLPRKETSESSSQNGMFWFEFGGLFRKHVDKVSGTFLQYEVNAIQWRYTSENYNNKFVGMQPMVYLGYSGNGKWFYASIAIGAGANIGAYQEKSSYKSESELPPKFIRNVPGSILSPYTPIDLDISFGVSL